MRLAQQVILITGASAGIGKAVAEQCVKEGARLVLNARNPEALALLTESLAQLGHRPLMLAGDATRPETIEAMVALALQQFGRIDGLVNNVGGASPLKKIEDITLADWDQSLDFNLKSAFLGCQHVMPVMKRQTSGRIVNVSSFAGRHKSRLGGLQYASAKAGLLGLTRHLANEVGSFGITVNAVAPGITLTPRVQLKWESLSPINQAQILDTIPLQRLAQPTEIAGPIVFLLTAEASYITGICLDVNGGSYMN